jgi:hypothetical protein
MYSNAISPVSLIKRAIFLYLQNKYPFAKDKTNILAGKVRCIRIRINYRDLKSLRNVLQLLYILRISAAA